MTTLTTPPPVNPAAATRPDGSPDTGTRIKTRDARAGWLFLAPFAFFYALFLIVPTLYMLITSFFNTSLLMQGLGSFACFNNYV